MLHDHTTDRRERPGRATLRLLTACIVMLGVAAVLGGLGRLPWSPWWTPSAPVRPAHLATFPAVVLWAWERPETLNFIDVRAVGVAFLARTLYLTGSDVIVRPRLQPFSAPPDTQLMAVVRMTTDRWQPPDLSAAQREMATAAITEVGMLSGIQALQVDFDATVSQREFYREVLHPAPPSTPRRHATVHDGAGVLVHLRRLARGIACRRGGTDGVSHGSRPTSRPAVSRR